MLLLVFVLHILPFSVDADDAVSAVDRISSLSIVFNINITTHQNFVVKLALPSSINLLRSRTIFSDLITTELECRYGVNVYRTLYERVVGEHSHSSRPRRK